MKIQYPWNLFLSLCSTVQYFQKLFIIDIIHIQLCRGCVWRHISVAVRGQGRLTVNSWKKPRSVLCINIQWCDVSLLCFLYTASCALTCLALLPAVWVPEKKSVAELPRLIETVPHPLHRQGFSGRFSLWSKCMRGLHFPRKHTDALS